MIICDICGNQIKSIHDAIDVDRMNMPENLELSEICQNCKLKLLHIQETEFKKYQSELVRRIEEYRESQDYAPLTGVPKDEQTMTPIGDLDMSIRARNFLLAEGILQVYQLLELTPIDILKINGIGKKTLREIKQAVAQFAHAYGRHDIHLMPHSRRYAEGHGD